MGEYCHGVAYGTGASVLNTHSRNQQLVFFDETGEIARIAEPQPAIANQQGMSPLQSVTFRYQQFRYLQKIRRFLRQINPDVVQVNPATMHWLWFIPFLMPKDIYFLWIGVSLAKEIRQRT